MTYGVRSYYAVRTIPADDSFKIELIWSFKIFNCARESAYYLVQGTQTWDVQDLFQLVGDGDSTLSARDRRT